MIYAKKTSHEELKKEWGFDVALSNSEKGKDLYVRCNKQGIVKDWAKATVYTASELVGRSVTLK